MRDRRSHFTSHNPRLSSAVELASSGVVCTLCNVSIAYAADRACIILQDPNSPYTLRMKDGAVSSANSFGVDLKSYMARGSEEQFSALENCVADGAQGLFIDPIDPLTMNSFVKKARDAGVIVFSLDKEIENSNATIAFDHFETGQLLGQWAGKVQSVPKNSRRVGIFDFYGVSSGDNHLRLQGFVKGYIGDNIVPRVACGCECQKEDCRKSCRECQSSSATILDMESKSD